MASRSEELEGDINRWAWERFDELRTHGTLTLLDGTVFEPGQPGFEEILRVVQFHAKRKPPRARTVPEPSDFVLKQTARARENQPPPALPPAALD